MNTDKYNGLKVEWLDSTLITPSRLYLKFVNVLCCFGVYGG